MPNHVHVVVEQLPSWSLGQIVPSWRMFTTRALNELEGTSGPAWASDYFDRYMRDEDHLQQKSLTWRTIRSKSDLSRWRDNGLSHRLGSARHELAHQEMRAPT